MATEKQSLNYVDPHGVPYHQQPAEVRGNNDAYFDQVWPMLTTRNLLGGAGVGAGAVGLWHLLKHFTSQKPSSAHTNFYAGPKSFPADKKKQEEKTAEAPAPAAPAAPSPFWGDQRPLTAGVWTGLNIAGVPLSILGGAYLAKRVLKENKQKQYQAQIEAARQEYERALGEKTATLKELYAANREKIAEGERTWGGFAGDFLKDITYNQYVNPLLKGYNAYAVGAGGLSAALAGKIVYDLTRQRSQAEMLRRAQDARARMSALPPMWVTPDDVIKQPAESEQRKAASA